MNISKIDIFHLTYPNLHILEPDSSTGSRPRGKVLICKDGSRGSATGTTVDPLGPFPPVEIVRDVLGGRAFAGSDHVGRVETEKFGR